MSDDQKGRDETALAVQLAELSLQMKNLSASVNEVKESVRQVMAFDRTIAELGLHHQQSTKEITFQWERLNTAQNNIDAVDKKADMWINRARGAWWTLMVLGGLAQALLMSILYWTYGHIRSVEDAQVELRGRLVQQEKEQAEDGRYKERMADRLILIEKRLGGEK